MSGLDSLDYKAHLGVELLSQLGQRVNGVVSAATGLLERGDLQDEADRNVVSAAVGFLEHPSENLADIMKQSELVAQVLSGYEMHGMDTPPEVDGVYVYLLMLQGANRIQFVESEIEAGLDFGSADIQKALTVAFDWAKVLSRAYKDTVLLTAVTQLQEELKGL